MLRPTLRVAHGPLMVSGFLCTLIGLERAVALDRRWTYLGPLFTGLGAFLLIMGVAGSLGPLLITLGSLNILTGYVIGWLYLRATWRVPHSLPLPFHLIQRHRSRHGCVE